MSENKDRPGISILCDALANTIDNVVAEWDMTTADVVGCLEMVKTEIIVDMLNGQNGLDKYYE